MCLAWMPAPRCAFHRVLVAPSFLRNAHMVDTHSCRPSFRPSHIVLFTGRSAQSLLAAESLSASPFCGPHAAVSVRETTLFFQAAWLGVLALPTPQPFPTDLREFSRRRHPRDLRAGSFAYAAVKVLQGGVLVDRLHGRLDQDPSQPRRTLPRDRALVAVAAGLMNARREARVGADLLGRAETLDLADFRDDQQRRVQADAVDVEPRLPLGERPAAFPPGVCRRGSFAWHNAETVRAVRRGPCFRSARSLGRETNPSREGRKAFGTATSRFCRASKARN